MRIYVCWGKTNLVLCCCDILFVYTVIIINYYELIIKVNGHYEKYFAKFISLIDE